LDRANVQRLPSLDRHIANNPALAGMNDAWLGAFATPHFAGYQPHAAGATVASAAVVRQVDAVAQSRIQQQLASARRKALPIYGDLVTFRHFLVLEASQFAKDAVSRPRCAHWGCPLSQVFGNRCFGLARQSKDRKIVSVVITQWCASLIDNDLCPYDQRLTV